MSDVIVVDRLSKTFTLGLLRKQVVAVKEVSFRVREGEIFGFVGPNGSGKTTTIKMLTGLIAPSSGSATLFGERIPSPGARARIGFSPENPYIYPYVTPREFVEMCGALSGLRGADLQKRSLQALERTGVAYAADRPARRLSKGMQQRTSLAAALVSDPDLLVLDEPMSGLDPVGRKEVRDLIIEEKERGKTIFFSTHILADVESLSDRVTVLRQGEVVVEGALRELLDGSVLHTDVTVTGATPELLDKMKAAGHRLLSRGNDQVIEVRGDANVSDVLRTALDHGANVVEVAPKRETLEDLFMRRAIGGA